jgi:hypothetical protein
MGFFDQHNRPVEPARPVIPSWYRPAASIIGKPLSNSVVMLQTSDCAVVLTQFVAYPNGLAWDISVRFADHVPSNRNQTAWEGPGRAMYGIESSDGTAILPYEHEEWPPSTRPEGMVLISQGGRGDDDGVTFGLWLNPLPIKPFDLIFAWKSAGIDEIRTQVDFANLAEEAAQALVLWPIKEEG